MADVTVREDGGVRIVQVGPMGPYGNNAYIVRDVADGASLLVDMPLNEGPLLGDLAAHGGVQQVSPNPLLVGAAPLGRDTLFTGGPGKTFAAGDLETIVAAIESRLLPLPPETQVLPGHGDITTIEASGRGVAAYLKSPKRAGFFGDVEWPAS